MIYTSTKRATVLVYTMVLVVIAVFMATVILNIAVQLSSEFDIRNFEYSLENTIKLKWDLAMKYATSVNNSWNGFTDVISCPTNITMSGTTLRTNWITTEIRYIDDRIVCHAASAHNGIDLNIFFNASFTDLQFAEYDWFQIWINASNLVGNFSDTDSTQFTLANTSYLTWDSIDDNFDSDNYNIFSTGSIAYPDWYIDNDSDGRLLKYGYVLEWSDTYNIFWSNSEMKEYIGNNPNNSTPLFETLWTVTNGYLNIDVDNDHIISLYEIDKDMYDDSKEIIIKNVITGTSQSWGAWYLQNDMTIANSTNNAFNFDFSRNDYALFIENTGSGTLLYQIRWESIWDSKEIYINPLNDSDVSLFSYLWSHILTNTEWRLIGDMFEVYWLKSDSTNSDSSNNVAPILPTWVDLWFDASDLSTIVESWGAVSRMFHKSTNSISLRQNTSPRRPTSWVSTQNNLNVIYADWSNDVLATGVPNIPSSFTLFFAGEVLEVNDEFDSISSIRSSLNFDLNAWNSSEFRFRAISDNHSSINWSVDSVGQKNIYVYKVDASTNEATIYVNGVQVDTTTSYVDPWSLWWQLFLFSNSWYNRFLELNFYETLMYYTVKTDIEINQIWNYLSAKWWLSWTDL